MINNINDFKKHNNTDKREKNLNLILDSNSYKLAQEDLNLLRSDEMRGVRMLLEITKPELVLEEQNICLLYTSPSPRDLSTSRMPSSA